ncbi:MAG: hypothetical protein Kow00123_07590 [Anaerolineales bacterium]
MSETPDIVYRVNARDEIDFVCDEWDDFAVANGGESVLSAQVLGRPIWDFITDLSTQEIYRALIRKARSGRSLQFTFRCDAPWRRRFLEMTVVGKEGGAVEFHTRTLLEEERPTPILLDADVGRSDELLRSCGWCKKFLVGDEWVEVEEAVQRLRLFQRRRLPSITHGICDECYEKMNEVAARA